MKIVFFAHPEFLSHQSMPKYAALLANGMKDKGHLVEILSPGSRFANMAKSSTIKKWLGYVDQYIIFPKQVKQYLKNHQDDTLFVFTDHALGPWVPLVKDHPHIVHCHDFLAQLSAIGEVPENPVSRTGKIYQSYIRNGYTQGKNFISISNKTKSDLQRFLTTPPPRLSEVIYNGLNRHFEKLDHHQSKLVLAERTGLNLAAGYILHVGGNLYYKNRTGVIAIYDEWRKTSQSELKLILVGEAPDQTILTKHENSSFKTDIYFVSGLEDEYLNAAYSGAVLLLYPSLAEGFGWPIAEAMASGCPVITTDEAPMNEVAGGAAFLIPKRPVNDIQDWSESAAVVLNKVVSLPAAEREQVINKGIKNVGRFSPQLFIDNTEEVYKRVMDNRHKR